jgi:subfamily B ATP-binding cassette protein MsbA
LTSDKNSIAYESTSKLMKRLWRFYINPYKGKILLSLFFMALSAATTAGLAKLMEPIIDDVFKSENIEALKFVSLTVFTLFILKGVAAYGESVTMNFVGQRIIANLQIDLFNKLLENDLAFFHDTASGVLISRCTNDVNLMRNVVSNTLTSFGKDLLTIVFLVSVMFYQDWLLSSIAFFVFPIAILPIVKIGKRMRKVSTNTQKENSFFITLLNQTFQGMRLVKSYAMEAYEKNRATQVIEQLLKLIVKANRIKSLSSPIMETLGGMAIVIVISYGGLQVIEGHNTAGAFFSFIAALLMAYEPMKRLANLNANLQEGLAATVRVFKVLDQKPAIKTLPHAKSLTVKKGAIHFKDVSFSYAKSKGILENITLEIPAGKTVALVGHSGSGKSTLLNLIPRFYDTAKGSIEIDHQSLKDVTLPSLRQNIGLVSQEITLFDDTIRANILYGKMDATEDAVIEAAKAAAAHDFIKKLPDGYDTMIGESGVRLSGGQRQRLAIARAMLKNAPILLLDEATSSLDTQSEKQVQKALTNLMKGRTCLVIAHRLSTIQDADWIYVMDQGKIVEQGTHQDLLKQKGLYQTLTHGQHHA